MMDDGQSGFWTDYHLLYGPSFGDCIDTLYDLRLVQATGYLYDCYLFTPYSNPETPRYRQQFWSAFQRAQPRIVVLTDQFCFGDAGGFDKVRQWKDLSDKLANDYVMAHEWRPSAPQRWWSRPEVPSSYRMYVRKD